MAYVFNIYFLVFIKLFFKRQYDKHALDIAAQSLDAITPPGPDLRADVINNLKVFFMEIGDVSPIAIHHHCGHGNQTGADANHATFVYFDWNTVLIALRFLLVARISATRA